MKKQHLMFISIVVLQVMVVVIVILNHKFYADSALTKPRLSLLAVAVLLITLVSMWLVYRLLAEERENVKLELLKRNLQQMEEVLKVLHADKHEFNHHIQTLQALIYLEKYSEALQYINGISTGRQEQEAEVAESLNQPVITALLNSKSNLAQSQNIQFALAVACDLQNLKIEAVSLAGILNNLIDNALEAALMDKNPRVGIEFKCEDSLYRIYVHNNGSKITDSMKAKIYQAGFTTKHSSGRGYGLMIAKKLTEENGGALECLNGETTTFIVTLPSK